jgi:hypothetical protein
VLLNPARQSTGILVLDESAQALPSTLPLDQEPGLAWWQCHSVGSHVRTLRRRLRGVHAPRMRA